MNLHEPKVQNVRPDREVMTRQRLPYFIGISGQTVHANKIGQTLSCHDLAVWSDVLDLGLMDVHRDGPPVLVFIKTKVGLKGSWLDNILSPLLGVRFWPRAEAEFAPTSVFFGERRKLLNQLENVAVHRILLA